MLNIALPKGRLGDKVSGLLSGVGYDFSEMQQNSRKLVFMNEASDIRYFLVKPSDVGIYVEHGAADVGVVGKDVLLETGADVYELLDLGIGTCRLAVAAPEEYRENRDGVLRVATKYPNVTKSYYRGLNRNIDIIGLHGSIELAPLLGLSDVIVDIVETGVTLRENRMRVYDVIAESSARLISNVSSYKFKREQIDLMTRRLSEVIDG